MKTCCLHHHPVDFSSSFCLNAPLISAANPCLAYLCLPVCILWAPASLFIRQLLSYSISMLHPRAPETDWLQTGCGRRSPPFLWKWPCSCLSKSSHELVLLCWSQVLHALFLSLSWWALICWKNQNLGSWSWIRLIITGCMEPLIHSRAF